MRFSVIGAPRQRWDLGETAAQAWQDWVEDALLAEKLGFDAVYTGEHHFTFASGNSSPFLLLTNVAARTERIRVGTSVICAPFHNPLRLAEDIAALDIVSKGRFDLGIGVGSQWEEFHTFGIDPKERVGRTWEIVDILERCLHGTEESFDHDGTYYHFPGVRWIMQPVQKRIPIFWGGFGPRSVARAAARGYHLIASDVTGTYERVMRENGRRPEEYMIGFVNRISIGSKAKKPSRPLPSRARGPAISTRCGPAWTASDRRSRRALASKTRGVRGRRAIIARRSQSRSRAPSTT